MIDTDTVFTPFYTHDVIRNHYYTAMKLHDALDSMPPLPWGQHATDSDANREIIRRHRALIYAAKMLREELHRLTLETGPLAS